MLRPLARSPEDLKELDSRTDAHHDVPEVPNSMRRTREEPLSTIEAAQTRLRCRVLGVGVACREHGTAHEYMLE